MPFSGVTGVLSELIPQMAGDERIGRPYAVLETAVLPLNQSPRLPQEGSNFHFPGQGRMRYRFRYAAVWSA